MRKVRVISLGLTAFLIVRCSSTSQPRHEAKPADTIPPVLALQGYMVDTAFVKTDYKDPGVTLLDVVEGELRCADAGSGVAVTGTVDTRLPSTHVLVYDGFDVAGNKAASVTRTVHVVQHPAGYLTGNYNVACTYTAASKSATLPLITTTGYTTVITAGSEKDLLRLSLLKVAEEDVAPSLHMQGKKIEVNFYSRSLHVASRGTGTVGPAASSMTLETVAYQFHPDITYKCTHVCTKQLVPADAQ